MLQHAIIEFRIHLHRQIDLRSQDPEYHRCTNPVHVTYALLSGEAFRQTAFHSYIRKNKIREKAGDSCQPQTSDCKCHPQKGCRCEKRGCCAGGLYIRYRKCARFRPPIRTLFYRCIRSYSCLSMHSIILRQSTLPCHRTLLR